ITRLAWLPRRPTRSALFPYTTLFRSERRAHFLAEYDWIRRGLMFEPRGHDMMSGSLLYPATREDCDIGVLYIETSGCLPMCGHRSEEHTSELQSRENLVCRLLLEKKN